MEHIEVVSADIQDATIVSYDKLYFAQNCHV